MFRSGHQSFALSNPAIDFRIGGTLEWRDDD
jgi:hypothetical protein